MVKSISKRASLKNLTRIEIKKPPEYQVVFFKTFPNRPPEPSPGLFSPSKCDPARARTEDPKIKSLLLYQLSYGVKNLSCKYTGNLFCRKFLGPIFAVLKREHSSAGSEHLPYKQRVRGSNPCAPTQYQSGFQEIETRFYFSHVHTFSINIKKASRLRLAYSPHF